MASVKRIELNDYQIDEYARTKVISMGNIVEVVSTSRHSNGSPCVKIDKDHYVDNRTGEVFEYSHIDDRSGSIRSIKNTLAHIRALVNTNVVQNENVRWVTLTYAENMTDPARLYVDFKRFMTRIRRWCTSSGVPCPEYISVVEPQSRGAWHAHVFFIWDCPAPYMDNNAVVAPLWGQGFTKTKALNSCDNVGAYFSAYLADLPLDELDMLSAVEKEKALSCGCIQDKAFENDQGHVKEKKFIKGGRLFMYPPGMNIIRTSRGIKRPQIELMPRWQAKEKVNSLKLTYSCGFDVVSEAGEVVCTISKSYYNSKRK